MRRRGAAFATCVLIFWRGAARRCTDLLTLLTLLTFSTTVEPPHSPLKTDRLFHRRSGRSRCVNLLLAALLMAAAAGLVAGQVTLHTSAPTRGHCGHTSAPHKRTLSLDKPPTQFASRPPWI